MVLRRLLLTLVLIDVALVVGRILTFTEALAVPGNVATLAWLAASLIAVSVFVIWFTHSKSPSVDLAVPTAAGFLGGAILIVHMALENFGARIGEDWRVTITAMLATFGVWFSSAWLGAIRNQTLLAGTVAGCWTAITSVMLAVTFGFGGMYFDMPASAYVETWPEYLQSGSGNPQAFAIESTLEAGTGHIVVGLLLGTILGVAGGWIGALQKRSAKRQD